MAKMKMKSTRGVFKRFKVTGTGKVMAKKRQGRGHLLAHKSSKRKRQLRGGMALGKVDAKVILSQM